jgi:two-component system, cell cycle sensor histidine kinase and response regulator CckA
VVGDDVTLVIHRAPELASTLADPGQMEQVVMNLVVNARDAMPSGGSIDIETRNVDANRERDPNGPDEVALSVVDTGVGMDAATRARIFEPFFTTKDLGKGTGLGLSTVWAIARQSGGRLEVESEPGRGTRLTLFLPRVTGEHDEARAESAPPVTLRGNETVLVVEDDEQVRAFVRDVLHRSGYRVLEAQNGGEAFLIAEQHPGRVHLLLTDVALPRMSGRDLSKRIQQMRPGLRVLYVSGYTRDAAIERGSLDRDAPFLSKPVTHEQLLHQVRSVLDGA